MSTPRKTKFHFKNKPEFEPVHEVEEYLSIEYLGYVGIIVGVVLLWRNDLWVGLAIMLCSCIYLLLFFLAKKQTKVDIQKKTITTRRGFRVVRSINYDEISSFYILAKKVNQKLNSRGSTITLVYTLYQGFVLADEQPYLLIESKNKKSVSSRLERIAATMNIEISDLT